MSKESMLTNISLSNIMGSVANKQLHSEKFQQKYIMLALHIASTNTACPSRQVAAVIVDGNNKVKGIGYNGPPAGTPHCHTVEYLTNVVQPKLSQNQQESLQLNYGSSKQAWKCCAEHGTCPRKFLGYGSGEAASLCSCQHAETNAIINAACDVSGCAMYCTLPPCINCAGAITNSRIREVHYVSATLYDPQVPYLLEQAKIQLIQHQLPAPT